MVHKTLGALKALTELGLIQKAMLQEFLHEVVPFLAHPVSNTVNEVMKLLTMPSSQFGDGSHYFTFSFVID